MKGTRSHQRVGTRSPIRAVSIQVRDYQVTVKVRTPVPQANKPAQLR
jgi:hypothetical protein